jgi:succinoglycan biosynthesis transport protein ExoP
VSEHSNSIDRDLLSPGDGGGGGTDLKSARDGVLRILVRRWQIVAGAVAACLLLAAVYLVGATRIYQSSTRLFVEPGGAPILSDASQAGEAQANLNFLFRQVQVIKSTPVLAMAVIRDDVQRSKTLASVDNGMEYLAENVIADVGRDDALITISAFSPDPDEAKLLVDAVREEYIRFQTKARKGTVIEALSILKGEKDKVERDLKANTTKLFEFRRSHEVISPNDDKNNILLQRLGALSEALTKAQLDTLNSKAAHDEALAAIGKDANKLAALARLEASGTAAPLGQGDNEDKSLRAELLEWQAYLQNMQDQFLPNHPRVQAAQRRVDQLNILYVASLGRRYTANRQREQDLSKAYEDQQRVVIARSADAAEYEQLQADVTRQREQIGELEKKMNELNVAGAATGMNITTVELGKKPTKPYSPDWKKTLAVAMVVGLMVGVMLACLRDWSDPRLHSAEEISAALGLPVLGQVPKMAGDLAPSVRGQTILVDPASEVAEACRSLRTAFHFGVKGRNAKTVLVASPNSGDGKSTLVSNLAIAIAQTGRKVLVIDADLRRPTQHEIFGVEDAVGLSTVLAEEKDASTAIQKSAVAHLDILPCGPIPENPAEILNSPHFTEMLEELSEKYDHVIIDSPPVVGVTDARIIAASCDATILVLKAESTNRKVAELTRDGLLSVGGHLLGVVLNGTASTGAASYGGYKSRTADDAVPMADRAELDDGDEEDDEHESTSSNGAAGGDRNGHAKAKSIESIRKVAERTRSAPGGH